MKEKLKPAPLPSTIGPSLATNMRELRKAKGWSQGELAERIDVHLTDVSRVETGKYIPALEFVVKAAHAFGVSVDTLLTDPANSTREVRIEDKALAKRLRLLEVLAPEERQALLTVIDSMR